MKKKLKKLFYLSLLLSGLIIAGCELQEDVIEQHNHQHELKLSQKRFSELLQDKNFTTAFSKIPKQKVLTTNVLGRTQMEDKYGFTIFDTPVNVMESDTLIAYNLLIKRDVTSEGSYVENLVMNIFPQKNRTDAYIIKYIFDGTTEINPENFFELEKKHVVTPIIFNNEPFDEVAKQGMVCIRLLEFQCCILGGNYTKCHVPDPSQSCVGSWQTVDVLCTTSAGSGGGYDYSGAGGGPPDPHQGGSNGNGNTHPVYNNPAPPCDPRVNCPVLEDTQTGNTPCNELNKLTKNPTYPTNPYMDSQDVRIRTAVINMSNNVNPSGEGGYGFYNQGNYSLYGPYANYTPSTANNHVNFPPRGYQFGTIHTHPNDGIHIPMFSHDDIYSLYKIRQNYALNAFNTSGDNLFVCVMTVKIGDDYFTYAIKIDDITKLQEIEEIHNDKSKWEKYGDKLENKYMKFCNGTSGTKTQYERTFLQFLKEQNLGVTLYEMEQFNVGTPNVQEKWKKLELATDNTNIDEIPCN